VVLQHDTLLSSPAIDWTSWDRLQFGEWIDGWMDRMINKNVLNKHYHC